MAHCGNRVTLSYRNAALSRPKEQNLLAFQKEVENGSITPVFNSSVKEIREHDVVLNASDGEKTIPNQAVFALLGSEIPTAFFKRSNIKMEGEKNAQWWVYLIAMVSFFTMLYFGKAGFSSNVLIGIENLTGRLLGYLSAPFSVSTVWGLKGYAWYGSLNFLLGWLGSLVFIISGSVALVFMLKEPARYFRTLWTRIKYGYFITICILFTWIYFKNILMKDAGWVEPPTFWYSLLYTTTITLFGIRRMQVKPTKYIIYQTLTLIAIQTFFLFLLPFFLYDGVVAKLFTADSWLIREVFPQGKWSSFGLVLFWPLNINNFGTSTFWTWFPFVQTFVILLLAVLKWGKGAYCGWICSCGAMAETLGDEYRTKSPHGPLAKKLDNIGQIILWWAFLAAALYFSSKHLAGTGSLIADTLWGLYKFTIDVFFAGVLGLGIYFFMGGRIWCRYGCPLAAIMHIYARFSIYRIMSNKKRCISCNICTKVCHMGIDVMNYANKGIPMNDVECVRCSACIVNCPIQVLTFGEVSSPDPDNKIYKKGYIPLQSGWQAGLPEDQISMLLQEEKKNHS
jgi:polyferredoxin